MKLSIKDNAYEFVESSIANLNDLLRSDPYFQKELSTRILKHLILSLSSAAELLIKIELCKVNELIIYSELSEELLNYYKIETELSLEDWLVENDLRVSTLEYSKCIDRLFMCTSVPEKYKKELNALKSYRNKIIHFGINSKEDYYKLLYVLKNVISLLTRQEPFSTSLEQYLSDNPAIQLEIPDSYDFDFVIDRLWAEKYNPHIEAIFSQFTNGLKDSKYEFASMLPDLDEVRFSLAYIDIKGIEVNPDILLNFYNYPEDNILKLTDGYWYGPIIAIIPISKHNGKQYIYYAKSSDDNNISNIDSYEKYWEKNGILGNKFIKDELTDTSIKRIGKLVDEYYRSYNLKLDDGSSL